MVLTDASGANRVYETRGVTFASWNGEDLARDRGGRGWTVRESSIAGPSGETLKRLPAHRAFWFGWYSAYPKTRLVK